MIPNENIITSSISNYSVRENRRIGFTIGLVYDTSHKKVQEGVSILKNILEKQLQSGKITDDIRVSFDTFNAFSLDIQVVYFSTVGPLKEYLDQKQEINLEIKDSFGKAGIEMAFPTQEMIIKEAYSPSNKTNLPPKNK